MKMNDKKEPSEIWFSYKQKEYAAKRIPKFFKWTEQFFSPKILFGWSDYEKQWDWGNCQFSVVGNDADSARVAVRRQKTLDRNDALSGNKIWLMLGIDVTAVEKPEFQNYHKPGKNPQQSLEQTITRWEIKITNRNQVDSETFINNVYIWVKSDDSQNIPPKLLDLYEEIQSKIGTTRTSNVFDVDSQHNEHIFPVIYQPRVDTLHNYIRAIFWDRQENEIEISVVFNDEQLKRAWFLGCCISIPHTKASIWKNP